MFNRMSIITDYIEFNYFLNINTSSFSTLPVLPHLYRYQMAARTKNSAEGKHDVT